MIWWYDPRSADREAGTAFKLCIRRLRLAYRTISTMRQAPMLLSEHGGLAGEEQRDNPYKRQAETGRSEKNTAKP